MNRSNKVIKNTIWELTYYLIVVTLGFLAPRYIILIYGSEINGLSATITQILNILVLLQSGATTTAIYSLYKPISNRNYVEVNQKIALNVNYFKKISLIFVVLMLISAILSSLFIKSNIKNYYIFIAFIFLGAKSFLDLFYTSKFRIVFTAFEEKFFISIATLFEQIIYYLLIFLTLYMRGHFVLLFAWLLLGCVFKIIYLNYVYKKKFGKLINVSNHSVKGKIYDTKFALANEVSHSVVYSSITVLLSFMYGLKDASVYSVYLLVYSAVSLITTSIYSSFGPSFGNYVANHDNTQTKYTFKIFQFIFVMLNSWMMACMQFLIVPFVRIYTQGSTDVNYINYSLPILLSLMGLMSAFRIPYNIVVSSYGFFKETWKQPVVSAIISILISIMFGMINHSLLLIGPICFYIINFIYQYKKLKSLVPFLITSDIFKLLLVSMFVLISTFILSEFVNFSSGVFNWILIALLYSIASGIILVFLSFVFLRRTFNDSFNYLKNLTLRK